MVRMHVSDLGESWLTFKKQELAASTHYTYRRLIDSVVCPRLGGMRLAEVDALLLQTLLMEMLSERSPNEALKMRAVLKGMFSYAASLRLLETDPSEGIRLPKGTGTHRIGIRSVPTTGEAMAMSNALPEPYSSMPLLAAFAGLRWQEVAALMPEDFDLDDRAITVQRAVGRYDGLKEPKSLAGFRKTIWAMEANRQVAHFVVNSPPDQLLFPSERGHLLHYSNWRQRFWVPACESAELTWTFHEYRHTFAVESLRRGRSVQSVSSMMGHTNPRVTWEFYAGLFEDHLDEARRTW